MVEDRCTWTKSTKFFGLGLGCEVAHVCTRGADWAPRRLFTLRWRTGGSATVARTWTPAGGGARVRPTTANGGGSSAVDGTCGWSMLLRTHRKHK